MPRETDATWPARPLKVLVVRGLDGPGGGVEHIVLQTAAALDPQRVQMAVCCLRHERDEQFDFDRRAAAIGLDYRQVLHSGPFDRRVLARLSDIVTEFGPDILHSHDYKASFFATRLARRFAVHQVATAHGWTGHKLRERCIYYPADKRQLGRFPAVIAVSDQIRQTLLRWGAKPDRVCVLLNAVDLDRYNADAEVRQSVRSELGIEASQTVLGAVGRLEPQKRFDLLIEAVARLQRRRPQLQLLIAGEGSQRDPLRRLIQQRGLQSVCRLLGHCPQMQRTYQAFDVLVQSSDYEGTPTVVVEAMALEIPVVATAVGGTGQLLEHETHGLLVPRRDTAALCRAIERTLDDVPATQRRVRAARTHVEQHLSFAQRTRRLERIYQQLIRYGELSCRRLGAVCGL